MSRIAVALPYAVSIRDFVHGGVLRALRENGRHEVVIYTLNPELPELAQARDLGARILGLEPYADTRAESALKRLYPFFFADQLAYISQALETRPFLRIFAKAMVAGRRALGVRRLLAVVSCMLLVLNRRRHLPRKLDPGVDLLIGTRSLINSLDYGLMAEAATYGVPVVTLAGSWDNFTTKGYFPFPVRMTVVWNAKMREELVELFGLDAASIRLAGYPRASLLRDYGGGCDPVGYLSEIGLGQYRRFVLISASYSELTRVSDRPMPLEYAVIRQVCEALVPRLPQDTGVLIRLHPFSKQEDIQHLGELQRCHVFIPGRQDRYVERVMDDSQERHLARQIGGAECVVSMASTMSIDALCLGKPILNMAFDPVPGLPRGQSILRFYEYNHFRDLVERVRLPLAGDVEEVVRFVLECVDGTYRSPVDFKAFEEHYVPSISARYPEYVRSAVEEAIGK